MKVTVLGSGTSTGVPIPGCSCSVCISSDSKNKRLRTSIFIEIDGFNLLVDTSSDLRQQALLYGIKRIDSVFYTHTHADHVCGIDDLRSFNFINNMVIPVYASKESSARLKEMFSYAFFPDPKYEGGSPPRLELNEITPYEPLLLNNTIVHPLPVLHGKLEVLGLRLGNFAYLTDCSAIPQQTREQLKNLDVLIIDGLRTRPHKTHFTHEQAIAEIEQIKPKKSYLIHLSHEVEHQEANACLKSMTSLDVELAYDGLVIN